MTKRQVSQYRMLVRADRFGSARKELFPEGSEGGKAFAVVNEAVKQIETFTDSKATAKHVSKREKRVARLALAARIGAIARSARTLGKSVPGAEAKFPLPEREGEVAVLQGGRLFVKEAAPIKDTFINCGLSPTFHEELQQAVATLEKAMEGCDVGKTSAFVAQKAIRAAVARGVDAVASLDVYVANALGHDPVAMNAWKKDRRVEQPGRTSAAGTAAGEQVTVPSPVVESQPPAPPALPTETSSAPEAATPVDSAGEPRRRAS